MKAADFFEPTDAFAPRHIGPSPEDVEDMLRIVGAPTLDALADETVPASIRLGRPLELDPPLGEHALLEHLRGVASKNQVFRSLIGQGYSDSIIPGVIQRNILENPGWYTQYTPYQAEIAQGRLEALVNFQTMVADLTGMPLANASLLDEATAAAEAMVMCKSIAGKSGFFVAEDCHPQTIAVIRTRAKPLGVRLHVGPLESIDFARQDLAGVIVQLPSTDGVIRDFAGLAGRARDAGALLVVAADLLSLVLIRPPGELGADIAVGSTQRFGVPLGAGGPHAAYLATREAHKRYIPGRIIGVSKDARGKPGYRLSLQTREQHIRRDKATSNICTAQVLLAIMAGMYAVYHGPKGLLRIARRVHWLALVCASGLRKLGFDVGDAPFFDTIRVRMEKERARGVVERALAQRINPRSFDGGIGVALDETTTPELVEELWEVFAGRAVDLRFRDLAGSVDLGYSGAISRTSPYLTHEVFNRYHSEHEMLRYLHRLEAKDLSLNTSMIPLGSCTMKLNATTEMAPVTWPELGRIHPFAPREQTAGYDELYRSLERWLKEITGFAAVSLQPNAGSQGEYTGLLVIRAYHEDRGEGGRDVCLIPTSAHGTNPASAVMAGMRVVPVACDDRGNIDLEDLARSAKKHEAALAALMITYPSTHGVFEPTVREVCDIVHAHGGQVYLDGANMNAQVGLCRPGDFGADVCHLNLHKTFCIPHGGGGPGMGPVAVRAHLAPYLPDHPLEPSPSGKSIGPVAAAPYGSPSILPISWAYIRMMGAEGLRRASQVAILNANYMAKRLEGHYGILYRGEKGRVAHEFIVDVSPFRKSADVEVDDIAKRLMDYGFHAPTMSWPVGGTMMIEPTESESKAELDRFCEAMIAIRREIREIEEGTMDRRNNPLKGAPHTADMVVSSDWERPYSREQAVFPAPWTRVHKFWPPVARIDNAYGDRNLICTCPPMEAFEREARGS